MSATPLAFSPSSQPLNGGWEIVASEVTPDRRPDVSVSPSATVCHRAATVSALSPGPDPPEVARTLSYELSFRRRIDQVTPVSPRHDRAVRMARVASDLVRIDPYTVLETEHDFGSRRTCRICGVSRRYVGICREASNLPNFERDKHEDFAVRPGDDPRIVHTNHIFLQGKCIACKWSAADLCACGVEDLRKQPSNGASCRDHPRCDNASENSSS